MKRTAERVVAAAMAGVVVSGAAADEAVRLPLSLSLVANARLEANALSGFGAPLPAGDPLVLGGVPFSHPEGNWAWNSHLAAQGGQGTSITVPTHGLRPDKIVTLMNTYWGRESPPAGSIVFKLTTGDAIELEIDGNVHVRDYLQNTYTNEIDPDVVRVVFEWQAERGIMGRMDIQEWTPRLPAGVGLAEIEIRDAGSYGESRLIVGGIALEMSADCNNDGLVDYRQILDGTYSDTNGNGVPDCCEGLEPCPGDLNGDDAIGPPDLGILLAVWGTDGGKISGADLNDDGTVNAADLGLLIGAWGDCGCN